MSGFGIHEQYAAGLELADEARRWREEAFLHQLSNNGSLMLAANHDELWRECMQRILGQPAGATWERMCALLRKMPAPAARQRLWEASYIWWMNAQRLRLQTLTAALKRGALAQLSETQQMRSLTNHMQLRGEQLTRLSWCSEAPADNDQGVIAVIDGRQRPGRHT